MNECEKLNSSAANVGDVLSGSWELTQRIFENLSFREVARLRAVCKLWADVGAKILEKRRKFHYLTVHPHHVPTTEGKVILGGASPSSLFEEFFEHIVSKPRYCIGFCNDDWFDREDVFSRDSEEEKIKLARYLLSSLPTPCDFGLVSASGIIGTVEQDYQGHWLESAHSVNQEILSYLYSKEHDRKCRRQRSCSPTTSHTEMQRELLDTDRAVSHSQVLGIPVNESSSSRDPREDTPDPEPKRSPVGYSIEVEARWNTSFRQSDAVTVLLIPHHPGVKLKFFSVAEENFLKDYRNGEEDSKDLVMTTEEFNRVTSLSKDDELKALLLFDALFSESFTTALVQASLDRQNQKLALGGGVVECYDRGKESGGSQVSTYQSIFGIAVCGPNVMAASVLIPKYVVKPKALDDYMKQLKACGLPEEQSLAFMFTCCGRGYSWYRRRGNPWFDYNNVESKAFRKFFPNTPIFGFFGGGEIGMSYLPKFNDSETETDEAPLKKRKKRFIHQYSTVIVLISFL